MSPATVDDLIEHWLKPDWDVPGVQAWCSTRVGCLSQPPYDGFNTASHVGDNADSVKRCREALQKTFRWQRQPQWLRQVHGTVVVTAQGDGIEREGDAVITARPGQVCTLHTADCLPVFFASGDGTEVALAHAGWRGLAAGILEQTVAAFQSPSDQLQVWLGPAISQAAFEVGDDVRDAFLVRDASCDACFSANSRGRWQCDLYQLARIRLTAVGIKRISGGNHCTYTDPSFFSFRRRSVTGRLLSLIWIDPAQ